MKQKEESNNGIINNKQGCGVRRIISQTSIQTLTSTSSKSPTF